MADQQFNIIANIITRVDKSQSGLKELENSLKNLKIPSNIDADLKKSFSNLGGLFSKYKEQLKNGFNTKGDVSGFAKTGKQIETEMDRITSIVTKLTGKEISLKFNLDQIKSAEKTLDQLISKKEKLIQESKNSLGIGNLLTSIRDDKELSRQKNWNTYKFSNKALESLDDGNLERTRQYVELLIKDFGNLKDARKQAFERATGMTTDAATKALRNGLEQADAKTKELDADIKKTAEDIASFKADGVERAGQALTKASDGASKAARGFKELNGGAQATATNMLSMNNQLEQLRTSTQYFFGLRNMINLLKQGFRSALTTVKELDKAMTATAVVTDFSVADMWKDLPKYTQLANELGATTQGAYETMTLYYQQGLNQQQAFALGAETMKMARIAGLDYAKTTDMMTAALRGFNMELNEVSAQRINDVYSNLAANTASNTQEIGEAMERTASIAHSAGMSFESTSAFLAQMIETTREAPENLGTAMKTIVARFQELKKDPLDMEAVDGEEVSYNKIDTALQSIGVNLKKANGEFRDLDDVFMDIAERWDSLSQLQQRYVATTAAGSRQQSRFIAMMSNYDRTQQLMGFATDSEGASQKQFEKTMDSMESKLNKLRNAWNEFLMGIADNKILKNIVDGTTKVITLVNKLISTLSLGSSTLKSVLSVFLAFKGLSFAGRGINMLLGGVGGMLTPGSSFTKGMKSGMVTSPALQAKAINQPIVNVLNQILGVISKGALTKQTGPGTLNQYRQANRDFRGYTKSSNATIGGAFGLLKGLDAKQAQGIIKTSPGTARQIQRSLLGTDIFGKDNDIIARQLMKSWKSGAISGNDLAKIVNNRNSIGSILGTKEAQAFSQSYTNNLKEQWGSVQKRALTTAINNAETGKDISTQQAKAMREAMIANERKYGVGQITKGLFNEKNADGTVNPLYSKSVINGVKQLTAEEAEALKKATELNGKLKGQTGVEKFSNALGAVGGAAMTAGQGCMALGNTLNSLGFEAAGAAAMSFGNTLMNLGMMVNGLLTALPLLLANPAVAAAVAGLAAIAAAIAVVQSKINKIKKEAEEVTTEFEDTQKTTTENINNIHQWKEEMVTLSKGVDENGLNVSLSNEDYARYLEIVDGLAEMHPELVEGYNMEGHAIIKNNEALEEALKLEQKRKEASLDLYNSEESLNKLLEERNLAGSAYSKYADASYLDRTTGQDVTGLKKGLDYGRIGISALLSPGLLFGALKSQEVVDDSYETVVNPLKNQVLKAVKSVKDEDWFKEGGEELLESFGIDYAKLLEGDAEAVRLFRKHQGDIYSAFDDMAGPDGLTEGAVKAFDKLGEATKAFEEDVEPVYKLLATHVSNSPFFSEMDASMQRVLMGGMRDLAEMPLSASEMFREADRAVERFADYSENHLEDVNKKWEEAKKAFSNTKDAEAYQKAITENGIVDEIEAMIAEAKEEGGYYGEAMAEYLTNLLAQITNYTESGMQEVGAAINTMSDEIAAANSALDEFNKTANKNDFSTAKEGYGKILEETLSDKHKASYGDATWRAGAEAVIGRENLDRMGKSKADKLMTRYQKMTVEGREGWNEFKRYLYENKDQKWLAENGVLVNDDGTIEFNIKTDEQFENLAKHLNMSKEFLTAMLNQGRQFANIDFSNVEGVRDALAASETSIVSKGHKKGEQEALLVSEEALRAEYSAQGIWGEKQDNEISRLETEQNVYALPTYKDFKNLQKEDKKEYDKIRGLIADTGQANDPEKFITAFGNILGKEDLFGYAEDLLGENFNEDEFSDLYSAWLKNQEASDVDLRQADALDSIDSNVALLASKYRQEKIEEGHADEKDAENIDTIWKEIYGEKGEKDTVYQAFQDSKDINGEYLTEKERKKTLNSINNTEAQIDDQITAWTKGLDNAPEYMKSFYEDNIKKLEQEKSSLERWKKAEAEAWETNPHNPEYQKKLEEEEEEKKKEEEERRKRKEEENRPENQLEKLSQNENYGDFFKQFDTKDLNEKQIEAISDFTEITDGIKPLLYNSKLEDPLANTGIPEFLDAFDINLEEAIERGLVKDIAQTTEQPAAYALGAIRAGQEEKQERVLDTFTDIGNTINVAADRLQSEVPNTIANIAKQIELPQPQKESTSNGQPQTQSNVEGTFNLNTDNALTALDNINKKVQETGEAAEKDKEYRLNTATAETKLASLEKKLKAASGGGGKTTTKTETKGQKPETKNTTTTNTVTTVFKKSGDDKVQSAINKLKKQKSINIPVYITSHFMGSWTKKLTIEKAAHGKNNHSLIPQLPSFGSLAKGTKSRYGQVGPNNKGGLTLTGEKGYEIAWIPSENRSMILGANGPQMLNLPKETVVWTHEQSKKILKQDAIPAGSHVSIDGKDSNTDYFKETSGSSKKSSKTSKKSSKKSKKSSKSSSGAPVTNWTIEEVIQFNIDQSLQALSYNIDKTTKSIEKSLKKIGTTSKDISGQVAEQVANIKAARKYNEDLLASYRRELKKLDTNYKEKISYSTGTGKKSKSKEVTVNLGSYIKQINGVYQLDKAAIQKAGPVALQEAITKAASSALSKITSDIDKAQKAIDEQNKKFDDLSKQISENFYEWENKVTEIYDLTKRIEVDKSFQERFSDQVALELSRLKSGFGVLAESIQTINAVNDRNNRSIQKQVEEQKALIQARREELERALEFDDELQELVRLRELEAAAGDDQTKLVEIQGRREYAADLYEAAEIGRQYLRDVEVGEDGGLQFRIDWSQFEADKLAGLMSKETADKVFDYFEKLNDASKEYNDSIKEQSSLLKETYDKLSEYYDYISNMEDTLLKGLEEEIQNEINNTKTLSTAITNALKDLLDEVKRKLDERRKKEDNAKTEADISKKQQRLAMLQADTANSNASEIAKLEKEIADAQQSYERTLEDQMLQKLQDQADKAAKQRERQIEIAQAHADIAKNTDENIEKINEWLMNPEYYKEAIRDAWLEAQGYSDKGAAGRMILEKQFESTFAELMQALTQSEYGLTNVDDTLLTIYELLNKSEILDADADVTGRNINGNTTIDAINARRYKDSGGSIKDAIEHNEFGIAELKAGGFKAEDFNKEKYEASKLLENNVFTPKELREGGYTAKQLYETGLFGVGDTARTALSQIGYDDKELNQLFGTTQELTTTISDTQSIINQVRAAFKKVSLDAKSGKAGKGIPNALKAMKTIKGKTVAIQNQTGHVGANGWIYWDRKGMVRKYNPETGQVVSIPYSKKSYINEANPKVSPYVYQEFRESLHTRKVKGYKTGGLATETGPAWLHGTPSKPELVLNAQDTRNFIALKDVLSRAINAVSDTDDYGNANFEININVDHVNSDYDVDRIAERVKKDIVKSAGYRNVTSVRKFR